MRFVSGRVVLVALLAARLVAAADAPLAQSPPPPPAPAGPAAIPVVEIPTRAERTASELRELRTPAAPDAALEEIRAGLARSATELQRVAAMGPLDATAELTLRDLEDMEGQLQRAQEQLASWAQTIGQRTEALESTTRRLRDLDETWALTAKATAREQLPDVVTREIATTRGAIREAQGPLREQRDGLLTIASEVGALQARGVDHLAEIADAATRLRRGLLVKESDPLWTVVARDLGSEALGEAFASGWRRNVRAVRDFLRAERARFLGYGALFGVVLALALTLRRRAGEWHADDETLAGVEQLAAHPVSAASVVAVFAAVVLDPHCPLVVRELAGLVLVVPFLRLLRAHGGGALAALVLLLAGLFVVATVRRMLPALSAGGRLLLIAENLGVVAWVLRALRPDGFALLGLTVGSQRTVLVVRQVALALMAVSLLANLVGNVSLAVLLSQGVLGSTFLAVGLYASGRVVEALLVAALHVAGGLGVRAVQFHAAALRRRVLVTIRFTTVALWVAGSLPLFGILRLTLDGVQSVLAARLEIGAVSLSAGNVVAFGLTLWLALVLARILRALLEDDILPRMALPRGVPSAVSAAVNYAILLFGFLLAMSAAGLDLGRVTLLAGALGVGIGFGLQNIVNNFVSGLILLFERPVRIGDVIEVGGVGGTVRHIGIRSSMIRTFEGAELIVPNGNLISERLINWTFSDYQRRVEMPVGVAYGNDPEQVIALLEGVAAGQPDVLKEPGPQALFLGFGPSSLDFVLRVWTARYDLAGVVRSRLLVALHGALRDAGIEIPFPQQEVHLRRAAPPARGPLPGGS